MPIEHIGVVGRRCRAAWQADQQISPTDLCFICENLWQKPD